MKARSNLLRHVRSIYGSQSLTPNPVSESDLSQCPPVTPPFSQISLSPTSKSPITNDTRPKPKISSALLSLLVYTVGVKCRGINKKEEYAVEHMFSLSENVANKMLRLNMWDLIKHTKTHLVRVYPKGTRVSSSNYEPHRFWAAGAQLVAINWQTSGANYPQLTLPLSE